MSFLVIVTALILCLIMLGLNYLALQFKDKNGTRKKIMKRLLVGNLAIYALQLFMIIFFGVNQIFGNDILGITLLHIFIHLLLLGAQVVFLIVQLFNPKREEY